MKKYFLIILFLAFYNVYSQEPLVFQVEMFFQPINGNSTINFYVDAVSQVWSKTYNISNLYDHPKTSNDGDITCGQIDGLDFVTSTNAGVDIFGYGLYLISSDESDSYFFLDYRDSRIGYYGLTANGHPIDVWITYDANLDKFSINSFGCGENVSEYDISINNGQIIKLWELKQKGSPSTDEFQNYIQNSLGLTVHNRKIRLDWNPNPNATKYIIKRALSEDIAYSPEINDFKTIGEITELNFIDNSIEL